MSDYLNHLAARGLNLTEVIKPRLAALFEPTHTFGGPGLGSERLDRASFSDETESGALVLAEPQAQSSVGRSSEVQPPVTDLRTALDMSQRQPSGLATISGMHLEQSAVQSPPLPTERSEVANHKSEINQPPGSPAPDLSLTTPPPLGRSQPGQPHSVSGDAITLSNGAVAQPPQPTREPAIKPLVVEQVSVQKEESQSDIAREDTSALPSRDATPSDGPLLKSAIQHAIIEQSATTEILPSLATARAEPSLTRTAHTVMAQPRVSPYVKPALPAPVEPLEAPQSAPTVQVTIGRIEVRATPPQAPPQRQRSAPPVMSLGEYLNQRGRGGDQ